MAKIVVVGAGVVGLTVALELLNQPLHHEVTIVASQVPTDFDFTTTYTSPFAGANWASFADADDKEQQKIDTVGYKKFSTLSRSPESGVVARKQRNFITHQQFRLNGNELKLPWFYDLVGGEQISLYDRTKFAGAWEYNGFVITTTYYLSYLLNECNRKGKRFSLKRRNLGSLSEAWTATPDGSKADIVVNCSGLRAHELVPDPEVYPVRGVTVLVENNVDLDHILNVSFQDPEFPAEKLYIMPRGDGSLLIGGCFEDNNTNPVVSDAQAERILARAREFLPQVGWKDFKVVRTQVGFRPFRKSGLRIELDEAQPGLVHCYGHGGAGFQGSWGSAKKVTGIVNKFLAKELFRKAKSKL